MRKFETKPKAQGFEVVLTETVSLDTPNDLKKYLVQKESELHAIRLNKERLLSQEQALVTHIENLRELTATP